MFNVLSFSFEYKLRIYLLAYLLYSTHIHNLSNWGELYDGTHSYRLDVLYHHSYWEPMVEIECAVDTLWDVQAYFSCDPLVTSLRYTRNLKLILANIVLLLDRDIGVSSLWYCGMHQIFVGLVSWYGSHLSWRHILELHFQNDNLPWNHGGCGNPNTNLWEKRDDEVSFSCCFMVTKW